MIDIIYYNNKKKQENYMDGIGCKGYSRRSIHNKIAEYLKENVRTLSESIKFDETENKIPIKK